MAQESTTASDYYFGLCEDPDDRGYGVLAIVNIEFWDVLQCLDDQLDDEVLGEIEGWPEDLELVDDATYSWKLADTSVEEVKAKLEAAGFQYNSALNDQYSKNP